MSVMSSGLRRRSWGITRPAPAAMLCLTHIKIEFRTLPMPPPLLAQVKTRCGFHSVFVHKDLTASESSGGSSKTSAGGLLLPETSVGGLLWRWIARGLDGLPHWTRAIQSKRRRGMHANLMYTLGRTLWRQIIAIMKERRRGPGSVVNKCQQHVSNGWWWCSKDYVGDTSLQIIYFQVWGLPCCLNCPFFDVRLAADVWPVQPERSPSLDRALLSELDQQIILSNFLIWKDLLICYIFAVFSITETRALPQLNG
jgi:hypothetical protein